MQKATKANGSHIRKQRLLKKKKRIVHEKPALAKHSLMGKK